MLKKIIILKLILFFLNLKLINGLSEKDFIFYKVKLDDRDCEFPKCGGYWLQRVNVGMSAVYVSSISLDPSIVNFNMSLITLAFTDDLILGGLIRSYPKFNYFQVYNATRLIYTNGGEKLYGPQLFNRKYQYLTINENNNQNSGIFNFIDNLYSSNSNKNNKNKNNQFYPFIAKSLNLNYQFQLMNFTEMYSKSIYNLDIGWLNNVITNSKTISFGFMDQNNKNFQITKIYINIPLIDSNNCLDFNISNICSSDQEDNSQDKTNSSFENQNHSILLPTFHRDYSRCLYFSGCINNNIKNDGKLNYEKCNDIPTPLCPKGYKLFSFSERPYGCKRYYCDVSFLSD
ncbi:hypothetical protein DDB_G0293402 [Dictyostelium discoideum AX4]|uniref:Uncharacterized protein n=1 Tax=Dictyostelium discoideum TaxID=44689 RepID=Q54BV3_DICDI|nr:hypothetical protein DDB_G0293402 [Dictyostelium discoideum AX4]EAL60743.1 hypothetical protein DDB_G0293402 [Dictyostelium discoideum AX4]|eukprot:XP_629156.1 hypothetical protein DDB_G0293402 [Dictyostelium discoideum AX4]